MKAILEQHRPVRARSLGIVLVAMAAIAVMALPADASIPNREIINFSTGDPATDPGTEGITVDRAGNLYVSANDATGGHIWKIRRGASEPEVLATLIPPTGGAGFGVLGLELRGQTIYAAVSTLADPELNGVWTIDSRTGAASHIPGTEAIGIPNDLTTWRSDIYVTDSVAGAIWRIDRDGVVVPWLQDELLEGLGQAVPGVPIGANGIDSFDGWLYVANLEKTMIVRVKIVQRKAGTPRIFASVDGFPDGLEVDGLGRPHVVLIASNALVRVGSLGNTTLIEDSNVLDAPSSLVFGLGGNTRRIYVVNYSIGEGFPDLFDQSEVGPGIVAIS